MTSLSKNAGKCFHCGGSIKQWNILNTNGISWMLNRTLFKNVLGWEGLYPCQEKRLEMPEARAYKYSELICKIKR